MTGAERLTALVFKQNFITFVTFPFFVRILVENTEGCVFGIFFAKIWKYENTVFPLIIVFVYKSK